MPNYCTTNYISALQLIIEISNLISQLRDALTMYQDESAKLGLQVSWMKTQLMHISDGPDPPPLLIGPDAVEIVS